MRRITLLGCAAVLLCMGGCSGWFAADRPPPETGEQAREQNLRTLEDIKTANDELRATLARADQAIGEIGDAADESSRLATVTANLRKRLGEGLEALELADQLFEQSEASLRATPADQDDPVNQQISDAGAVGATAAQFLPPPWNVIGASVASLVPGVLIALRERRKRTDSDSAQWRAHVEAQSAREEAEEVAEAVRDLVRGLDQLRAGAEANGGAIKAADADKVIKGKLSEKTRKVVGSIADHPLAEAA